jgi:hypothetical protein
MLPRMTGLLLPRSVLSCYIFHRFEPAPGSAVHNMTVLKLYIDFALVVIMDANHPANILRRVTETDRTDILPFHQFTDLKSHRFCSSSSPQCRRQLIREEKIGRPEA